MAVIRDEEARRGSMNEGCRGLRRFLMDVMKRISEAL
jgi:hypothetical protein